MHDMLSLTKSNWSHRWIDSSAAFYYSIAQMYAINAITADKTRIKDRRQTNRILTSTFDLEFQSWRAMIVTHTHAKDQGQRSVSLKDKVETDRLHYLPC